MTFALAAAIAMGCVARAGDELPRYRLERGMELSYKGSSTFRHQNGTHQDDTETTAWVVRRNGDGSVRVVLRQGSRFTATSASSLVDSLKSLFKKQDKPPMEYQLGYFDLFPDGRLGPDAELGYRIAPASLFPACPSTRRRRRPGGVIATSGWARSSAIRHCGPSPAAGPSRRAGRAREQDLRHDDGLDVPPRHRAVQSGGSSRSTRRITASRARETDRWN